MGKKIKNGRSVLSLPCCIVFVFFLGIILHSFSSFKQSESELQLKEEVKALSEEFGLDFSVTLAELVKREIVSPTLAVSLLKAEGLPTSSVEGIHVSGHADEENEAIRQEEAARGMPVFDENLAKSRDRDYFEHQDQWRRPGEKYFVYQTSGGLSNQRIILESALIVGKYLNRTVVLPGLGPHTSMWYNFNKIPLDDFIAADELLDGPHMGKMSRILPLRGLTLKRFIEVNEEPNTWKRVERNKLGEKRANPWSLDYLKRHFGSVSEPVLFFARGTMWECFDFPLEVMNEARRSVRAHPSLRRVARDVVERYFPKGFNSLHIRFMDGDGTDLREGLLKPGASFVFRMRKFDKSLPLYVATVPNRRKSEYFNPFKEKFRRLVFGNVLERDEQVVQALEGITRRMKDTVLGFIEQLVCARAERFLGTGFSTFSEHIRRMRRWRELVAVTDLTDAKEISKEEKYLSIVTPCTGPMTPC